MAGPDPGPEVDGAALRDLVEAEAHKDAASSTRTLDGLPPVTIVPATAKSIGPLPSITVLRDGTVGFVPDQSVFRDPAQARAVLADYAREITNGRRTALTGTTASAGPLRVPAAAVPATR